MELTLDQKQGAYKALLEYLIRVTHLEASGHLAVDTVKRIDAVRDLARRLIVELGERLNEREALSAGLLELVSEQTKKEVEESSEPTANNQKLILKYFNAKN